MQHHTLFVTFYFKIRKKNLCLSDLTAACPDFTKSVHVHAVHGPVVLCVYTACTSGCGLRHVSIVGPRVVYSMGWVNPWVGLG